MALKQNIQSLIFSVSLLFLAAISSHAADATFSWTANVEPVSGYKIHYGTSSRNYTFVVDAGLPEPVNGSIVAIVSGLLEGQTYYFAATAYSATEESDYSVEVVHMVPGAPSSPAEPPVAGNINLHGSEDSPLSGQLSGTSADGTALQFAVVSQPGHGTLTVQDATGTFTYTPAPNYSGSDTFSYTAANSVGTSAPATVTILLDPVNDAPVATSTSISTEENSSYSGQLSATDIEGNTLTYSLVAQAGKGTATLAVNGSFNYTPNHDISGTDSFTFKVSDGSSISNTASVAITIHPVNKAPITSDSTFSVDQNTAYSGQLAATDEDGDAISFTIAAGPQKGTIVMNSNGSYTYTPDPDASGADLFTFVATDGKVNSNAGTVNILINVVTDVVANKLAFELGELQVTSDWQHVDFSNEYTSPSVVAKSNTSNNPETGLVTIKNLTSTGFDIRIREWDNKDGLHPEEIVFMAMERGHHQIADNVYIVAECTSLSGLNTFEPVAFSEFLPSQPVVLSSIVTTNDTKAAILRMKDITPQGFSITMQEQENSTGNHAAETVCYIAMEEWTGVVDNLMVEVSSTKKALSNRPTTVLFKQQFPTIPFVLADMQSAKNLDTATLVMSNLSITGTIMTILEEQSADNEVRHLPETGGYLAITPYQTE